jgi:hypothetical protein
VFEWGVIEQMPAIIPLAGARVRVLAGVLSAVRVPAGDHRG